MEMSDTYYMGAYWPARLEDSSVCAERTAHFLNSLTACNSDFSRWYRPASTLRQAQGKEVDPNTTAIEKLLKRSVSRHRNAPLRDRLGYVLALWALTHDDPETKSTWPNTGRYAFFLGCSEYSPIINICTLNHPLTRLGRKRFLKPETTLCIMMQMVRCYDPSWAVTTSHDLYTASPPRHVGGPHIGWITYLPIPTDMLPSLPEPSYAVPSGNSGSLLVAMQEHCIAAVPEHVAVVRRLTDVLDDAGYLQPVR